MPASQEWGACVGVVGVQGKGLTVSVAQLAAMLLLHGATFFAVVAALKKINKSK